jgi:hypothetical protein
MPLKSAKKPDPKGWWQVRKLRGSIYGGKTGGFLERGDKDR